jgi:phage FluMu protein Com
MNVIFIFTLAAAGRCRSSPELKPTHPTCSDADPAQPDSDCRCLCGSLLARVVDGGVELKCRRCKRTLLVPFEAPATPVATSAASVESIPVRRAG